MPPEPASEATVSLPPMENLPLLTVSVAATASVLADVVANVPPPRTNAVEASVTPLAAVMIPELTVVMPAHDWLALTWIAVVRPPATVKSILGLAGEFGPSSVLSVRFVTTPSPPYTK